MAPSSSRSFYKDLPAVPAETGMCEVSLHREVPPDWCVAVVDIAGSTKAIEAGQYKDVNMISASAITAALNAAGREDIAYIFGGDGATLLIPPDAAFEVAAALYGTRRMARESFGLDMRAGFVWMEELNKRGAPVRVAKTEIAPGVCFAALSGEGVTLAEKIVKDRDAGPLHDVERLFAPQALAARPPDFNGLGCRWQPLYSRNGVNISLIVLTRRDDGAALYREVLDRIAAICGKPDDWKPVSDPQLKLWSGPGGLAREAKLHTSGQGRMRRLLCLAEMLALSWVGKICLAFGWKAGQFDGRAYKAALVRNTDFIKFDNVLRLVMDLTPAQKDALSDYLKAEAAAGRIFYGMHEAQAALMTCMVFDFASQHFHFIDGADGGYALAAKQMKQQMAQAGD